LFSNVLVFQFFSSGTGTVDFVVRFHHAIKVIRVHRPYKHNGNHFMCNNNIRHNFEFWFFYLERWIITSV
jgi:hypothetical protein